MSAPTKETQVIQLRDPMVHVAFMSRNTLRSVIGWGQRCKVSEYVWGSWLYVPTLKVTCGWAGDAVETVFLHISYRKACGQSEHSPHKHSLLLSDPWGTAVSSFAHHPAIATLARLLDVYVWGGADASAEVNLCFLRAPPQSALSSVPRHPTPLSPSLLTRCGGIGLTSCSWYPLSDLSLSIWKVWEMGYGELHWQTKRSCPPRLGLSSVWSHRLLEGCTCCPGVQVSASFLLFEIYFYVSGSCAYTCT